MSGAPSNVVEFPFEVAIAEDAAGLAKLMHKVADRIESGDLDVKRLLLVCEDSDGQIDHGAYGERTTHAQSLWMLQVASRHVIEGRAEE